MRSILFSRICAILFAFSGIVLVSASPALSQQGIASPVAEAGRIEGIAVTGTQRIESATIISYLSVRIGDPFDPAALDDSLKRLFATGLFADVSFDRRGNTLIIDVVENPIINRIVFEGNKRLKNDELSAEVQLRPRIVFTRAKVQADVQRMQIGRAHV